jgi:uncharacterized UPF0160 family protein
MFKESILEEFQIRESLTVAVHAGNFHADDVFSVALLKWLCTATDTELSVIRTRDYKELQSADMRVDVGGKHNPATWDFDHHQNNDASLDQPNGIKHAAIGLLCQWCMEEDFLQIFREKYLYGLEYQDNTGKSHEKYNSIGFFIQPFLPVYGQKENLNELFWQAVAVAEIVLARAINTTEGILKCEKDLPSATEEVLVDGKILVLTEAMPIQNWLHPEIAFVIAKAKEGYSFLSFNGALVKENLRGLRGKAILNACGYAGTFIHKDGFTGAMATLEGAKAICLASL